MGTVLITTNLLLIYRILALYLSISNVTSASGPLGRPLEGLVCMRGRLYIVCKKGLDLESEDLNSHSDSAT